MYPIEETVDAMGGQRFYLMECADEARQLIRVSAIKGLLVAR